MKIHEFQKKNEMTDRVIVLKNRLIQNYHFLRNSLIFLLIEKVPKSISKKSAQL